MLGNNSVSKSALGVGNLRKTGEENFSGAETKMAAETQSQKPIERVRQSQKSASNALYITDGGQVDSTDRSKTDMEMGQSTHIKKEKVENPPDDDIEVEVDIDEDYSDDYDEDEHEN